MRLACGKTRISERRACVLAGLNRSTHRYPAQPRDDSKLRQRLRELAAARRRWGCPMLTLMLRREGFTDNHKRIERIYREEGLQVRKRRRKRRRYVARPRVAHPDTLPNDRWAADFVHDSFLDGRPFRCLTMVDHVTRDSVEIVVGRSIGGHGVVEALERLRLAGRTPRTLQVDNGPEFRSFVLDQWCHEHGAVLDFIQPGKPTQNAHIESFNGRFREECLNENWFLDLKDAQAKIEAWRIDYNDNRPHTSNGGATPSEVLEKFKREEQIT